MKIRRRTLVDHFYILFGSMVAGLGVALFTTPMSIAGGGVNGVATILYHLWGWDTGFVMLCINVPLVLIGVKVFGRLYGVRSIVGSIAFSLWVSFFGILTGYRGVLPVGDRMDVLLAAVIGGALVGSGIGIVMRGGANTGGTDIIAQILNKYTPLPIGICTFIPDALVILAGFWVFGVEGGLFAIISLYVSSAAVNFVVMDIGTKYAKTASIFSERYERIGDRIIHELGHGCTVFTGKGLFTGKEKKLLVAVVPNQQINRLESIVHEEDPKAFLYVTEAYQVLGEGFVPMERILSQYDEDQTSK